MRAQTRDPAAREAKLEAVQQQLTSLVGALVSGEDWKRALEFAARFRSRSFNNTMLIHVQHHAAFQQGRVPEPMPTYVAGFRQWLSVNRHVVKGQSGYAILARSRPGSRPRRREPPSRGGAWAVVRSRVPVSWWAPGWSG